MALLSTPKSEIQGDLPHDGTPCENTFTPSLPYVYIPHILHCICGSVPYFISRFALLYRIQDGAHAHSLEPR
jgi:hypothetical protein